MLPYYNKSIYVKHIMMNLNIIYIDSYLFFYYFLMETV